MTNLAEIMADFGRVATKRCSKCGETKPLSAFNRQADRRDGLQSQCRECRAANAAYRAANPERVAATKAAWYADNRERAAATQAAWYEANRERVAATNAAWAAANRERMAAIKAAWLAANPEKGRAWVQLRRARLAGVDATLTPAEWDAILARFNGLCLVCGAPWEHMDHVVPLAMGGAHVAANVLPMCARHNLSKGAKELLAWLDGRWVEVQ